MRSGSGFVGFLGRIYSAGRCEGFAVLILAGVISFASSCQRYKPSTQYRNTANGLGAAGSSNIDGAAASNLSLVLANTKLTPLGGPLTARITFGGTTVTKDFTPSGTQSTLEGLSFPSGSPSLMTIEILQGSTIKFIAKRANTSAKAGQALVIDDCMILTAPWQGTANDGSCEWTISEVN